MPKIKDFIATFADGVDSESAQEALSNLTKALDEYVQTTRQAKILVMEVFLLKAVHMFEEATAKKDSEDAEKHVAVIERQLAFLPGNILDMTDGDFQQTLMQKARRILEPKAQAQASQD